MIDYFNTPISELEFQVFHTKSSGATSTNDWQIWTKPKNCKFIYFMVIGGGGGGGFGVSGGAGTSRNGGGGGGSSSVTKGLFPANLLPDILYVLVGKGGLGSSSLTAGGSGGLSYISTQPNTTLSNLVLASGNSGPTGGFTSGNASAGVPFTQSSAILSYYGVVESSTGSSGGSPGSGAGGTETQDAITGGGAPGAGTISSSNAGGIIAQGLFTPSISGGAAGRNSGNPGVYSQLPSIHSIAKAPLYFTGGSGGGSNNGGIGGDGGDGSYGSGGGGGGAGTTGGRGGDGGNGIVIIVSL